MPSRRWEVAPNRHHTCWPHMASATDCIRRLLNASRMLSPPLLSRPTASVSHYSSASCQRLESINSRRKYHSGACSSTSSAAAAAAATAAAHPTPAEARAMEAHRAALAAAAAAGPPLEGRTYAPEISWEPEVQAYLEAALGTEQLRRISAALARPPLATCLRVNTLRTTPEVGGEVFIGVQGSCEHVCLLVLTGCPCRRRLHCSNNPACAGCPDTVNAVTCGCILAAAFHALAQLPQDLLRRLTAGRAD